MEPNSPKKIQFAVPLFQSQIDPEAAEQIRKRRPTPASLVIMNEHMPPEALGRVCAPELPSLTLSLLCPPQSQSASPKQRKQSVFTPPALKG
ncbi:PPR1C phosphatase, partial [Toxostoma redivivum]|nr:PPR1C phosphatase [Toxostoma redivivum]